MSEDQIRLSRVRVSSFVGVPDEERAVAQTLEIDAVLIPDAGWQGLEDEIDQTIDYHAVWLQIRQVSAERPRKLIETLAEDLATRILTDKKIKKVGIEVRKFILPDTGSVSVSIWREQQPGNL